MLASADNHVGKLYRTALRKDLNELGYVVDRAQHVLSVPEVRRRRLDAKQCIAERQALPLGKEAVVGRTPPLRHVHHIEMFSLQTLIEPNHRREPSADR